MFTLCLQTPGEARWCALPSRLEGVCPAGSNGPTSDAPKQVADGQQPDDRRLQPLGPDPERLAGAFDGLPRCLG
jgi:hypothetical protein